MPILDGGDTESGVDKWKWGLDLHRKKGKEAREKTERERLAKMTQNRDPGTTISIRLWMKTHFYKFLTPTPLLLLLLLCFSYLVNIVTDHRTRSLLREIDRATDNRKEKMDSDELHEYPQRFPAHMLRIELENALEAMLREEILDRERSK